jgi:hypothetical protein
MLLCKIILTENILKGTFSNGSIAGTQHQEEEETMTPTRTQQRLYWIVTALFLVPMAGSGAPELVAARPAATAATIVHLGYPLYLMRILGLAKLLGAVAIVSERSRRLKEWAYAGYAFNLLGAVASHLFVGDGAIVAAPAAMLALVLTSYRLWSAQGRL